MSIFDEPKVDCHNHLLDPTGFGYAEDAVYEPPGHEQSSAEQMLALFDAYRVNHALLVGPNSGHNADSSPIFDLMERAPGRFKAAIVPPPGLDRGQLRELRDRGVIALTFQLQLLGTDFLHANEPLVRDLADLDMFADVQVHHDQLLAVEQLLRSSGVRVLIDHCGRPNPTLRPDQPGFTALLGLAALDRVTVKLSGLVKCSASQRFPYVDAQPFVQHLLSAFAPDQLVWGSDWPFLRAPQRIDYGVVLRQLETMVPDDELRRRILWHNPVRLFGF